MVAILLLSMATFFASCEQKAEEPSVKIEVKAPSKKSNGVVYVPSPLANEMRRMYDNMKIVNELLKSGENVDTNLLSGYEAILTAEATTPSDLTPEYYGFAKGWLSEVDLLKEETTLEHYNNVMNSCVHCHESFCPGPIPKIKKLNLIPSSNL